MPDVAARPRVPRIAREVLAVLVAGLLTGIAWLIPIQEAAKKGWTDHEFNSALGEMLGATGEGIPRWGLVATLALGVLTAMAHALVSVRAHRHWLVQGLVTGVALFLLWGLVFSPMVERRGIDVPAGVFGAQAGTSALVWVGLSALAAAVMVGRVYSLMRGADWWEPKHFDLRESIDGIFTSEKRDEPGGYRPDAFTE
jgi:hypothetical protein